MKYIVNVNGQVKHIEATQFFCENRMVIFTKQEAEPPGCTGLISYVQGKPEPVAAYPMECIESIESAAVTQVSND